MVGLYSMGADVSPTKGSGGAKEADAPSRVMRNVVGCSSGVPKLSRRPSAGGGSLFHGGGLRTPAGSALAHGGGLNRTPPAGGSALAHGGGLCPSTVHGVGAGAAGAAAGAAPSSSAMRGTASRPATLIMTAGAIILLCFGAALAVSASEAPLLVAAARAGR